MFTTTKSVITAGALLAAASAAQGGFILGSSVGQIDADASINGPIIVAPLIDPDPGTVDWDEFVADGAAEGDNSSSSSAGQLTAQFGGDLIEGEGSANASTTANGTNNASAAAGSLYTLTFTVDTPMKIGLGWSFFATSTDENATFLIGWEITADDIVLDAVQESETSPMMDWDQSGFYSLDAVPGVDYEFNIGAAVLASAGTLADDPFSAAASQWTFTMRIPSPSTLALLAPAGLIASRRRR